MSGRLAFVSDPRAGNGLSADTRLSLRAGNAPAGPRLACVGVLLGVLEPAMGRREEFLWRSNATLPRPAMLLGAAVLLRPIVLLRRALLVVGRMKLGV